MEFIAVFGDQTQPQWGLLRDIYHSKPDRYVAYLLEKIPSIIRDETRRLPRRQRDKIPDFTTFLDLVRACEENQLHVPQLDSCMVTTAQLLDWFRYYTDRPEHYPTPHNARVVGICTGMIAGAAVASARSLPELLPLALRAVRYAFRLGTETAQARDGIEPNGAEQPQPWSYIVADMTEGTARDAIDRLNEENQPPLISQPYVSAIAPQSLTISGPPTSLRRLRATTGFHGRRVEPIGIYAPHHAPHIFTSAAIERILDENNDGDLTRDLSAYSIQLPMHSAVTGGIITALNARELFREALAEILCKPVNLVSLLDELANSIRDETSKCTIHVLGKASGKLMRNAIRERHPRLDIVRLDSSEIKARNPEGSMHNDKIAIVGMAGRFPEAADHEELWDLLMKGLDVHRHVPPDRFDADAHCDPSGKGKNKSHTPYGCFIKEPGLFDARFFNMSPREAKQTDPMGRLALVTAYEALEMAGYVANRTPSSKLHRIGTFYGQTSDDWREINAAENIDTYFITGGVRAFAPGRINFYFKFSGPSFSIDTACSSSLAAIQLACTSLWAGDCDTACAGGLNVLTNPDIFAGLSKGSFLSKTGGCKTFDNDADGYCRGDGCGTVILKRYADAIADNDNILGCILSAGTNHSAQAVSITHPHAPTQMELYKEVLAKSGVDPHEVTYVEMHGTGTQAGDATEMQSVLGVFAPPERQRTPERPLHLGAIKANIGHGEAASGINSLIKVLLMMERNAIPANVGIKGVINKGFPNAAELRRRNVHIPTKAVDYPRQGSEKRKIFLNNFSAAGGNTSLLLEDGPLRESPTGQDPRTMHIVTVTARSITSLKQNIRNLISYLDDHPETTLPSLAYTTTARRIQHFFRVALCVSDIGEVKKALESELKDTYEPTALAPTKVAFAFTGQGSQYTGLGQRLYNQVKSFKSDILYLNSLANVHGLPSILPLLEGKDVDSLSPVVLQLGMTCIQVAMARMWQSWGVKPASVVGHSLGEYAALCVAGVLAPSDMILLVGERAKLIEQRCTPNTHGMLAVKGSVDSILSVLQDDDIEIACINGPTSTVLAGTVDRIAAAQNLLQSKNMSCTRLAVSFAFHSAQVDPILEPFRNVASTVPYRKPEVPVLSPLLGIVSTDGGDFGPDYLCRHARETVNMLSALQAAEASGICNAETAWLEIGADRPVSSMIRATVPETACVASSLRKGVDPWQSLSEAITSLYLAGVPFDFYEYHREYESAHRLLRLPTYHFDNSREWLDYHNNWCLTKGEDPRPAAVQPQLDGPRSRPLTTSCQFIVRQELNANSGTVVVQSDLSEPKLRAAISGHEVDGNPFYPSSLYADQAMTVADYLYRQLRPNMPTPGLNVHTLEATKALIPENPPPEAGQHIQIEATANLELNEVRVKFRSVSADGQKVFLNHAEGVVKYENIDSWTREWARCGYMVQNQINSLEQKLHQGQACKFTRAVAYKLFQVLVSYAKPYRGMDEVIINQQDNESTAVVRFQTTPEDGDFYCSPYWIDSLAHLSGFTINTSEQNESDEVYISHGWESLRISTKLSPEKKYRSYVRMQPAPDVANVSVGDVYIFEEGKIIGMVNGLKFRKMKRKGLKSIVEAAKAENRRALGIAAGPSQAIAKTTKTPKSAPKPSIPAGKTTSQKPLIDRVLEVISAQCNLGINELVDGAYFARMGVDSLMALDLTSAIRDQLGMEISNQVFIECPTVKAFKQYLIKEHGTVEATVVNVDAQSATSEESSQILTPVETTSATTPASSASSVCDEVEPVALKAASGFDFRAMVAESMHCDRSEITDKIELSVLGMDSIMSLELVSQLRERGHEVPQDFFQHNPTAQAVEQALGFGPKPRPKSKPKVTLSEGPNGSNKRSPQLSEVSRKLEKSSKLERIRQKNLSVILQGTRSDPLSMFLIPDGSGSATSYQYMSRICRKMRVSSIWCPFLKEPQEWTSDIGCRGIAQLYKEQIKKQQPQGPYILGGWSAGGVLAYEVAYQLIQEGDKVSCLVLIDSPCPVRLDPLPARLHVWFEKIGLLGKDSNNKTPDWLLPHFTATINNLKDYTPDPMEPSKAPKVIAVWCREGVCPDPNSPRPPPGEGEDPAPMKWLLDNRTDFGDNGWAALLPMENFYFKDMGGNHFTMMKPPYSETLASIIGEGLAALGIIDEQ
ncbi:polyketide synthase-like protein [Westerdykella ornata]|uniref:Polyketide synthase-like protein n=1 Tax=Westerdykella ornata TaxID=318751 RepID=A0A6A6JQN9_WESOR|nr:polyketide synthase-like protein [Westerdykella ornata]KAF2278554.1 polyketide synthase-like protein [Westerdykella ornata]